MFACPLFCKFRELNKTAKLNGANTDTIPTVKIGVGVKNVQLAHHKTTGLHYKGATVQAARVLVMRELCLKSVTQYQLFSLRKSCFVSVFKIY